MQERRRNKYADMTEEEMEKYFQERHAQEVYTRRGGDLDDQPYDDDITQNGLLPSTKDPNLWIVKVRMGEEKQIALQLMRKYLAFQNTEEPLQIKSVVVKEGLKGIIYIEAFKKSHVATAIEKIAAINQYQITMVPIGEMVDSLKVVKDIPSLKPGTYVRLKRTMYKDDLAQVDWVDIAQNRVNLKLVPRVDYTRMRGALRNPDDRAVRSKRRPQPKLFDLEKIKSIGGEVTNDGDFVIFEGGHYRRGFLYKEFPMNSVIADGVKPSLTELERFQETADDLRKELESTTLKEKGHSFAPGDNIEVTDGELVNLRGTVQSVDGDKVVILPHHKDLTEPLTLNAFEMRKFFKAGDHVRVVQGRYEGDTGLILRVEDNLVILISDLTMDELKVLPKDVQLCADVATGVDSIGQYQYQDLVMLDKETVGVIVRLEREHVEVLTMHGKTVRVKPQAIQCKKESKFAKAMDSQKNTIQAGDLVKIVDGPHANKRDIDDEKEGVIKHLFRTWAFIYSRKHPLHGGIFVCKTRHLLLAGAKHTDTASIQTLDADLLRSPNPLASPHPSNGAATPALSHSSRSVAGAQSVRGGAPGYGGGGPISGGGGGVRRNTAIIGKNVRISQGQFKGYYGIVKDATDTTVRVELHTMPKTINMDMSKVVEVGGAALGGPAPSTFGRTPNINDARGRTPTYGYGSQTPMYGGGANTPMHDGGRTPHYGGGMTPAYDAGGRTPTHSSSWDPAVANTPAHPSSSMDDDDFVSSSFGSSGFGNSGFGFPSSTPNSQRGQTTPYASTTPKSGTSAMYSDYAAASPYPKSNYNDSATASPFHSSQGPTIIPENFLKSGEWCKVDLCVNVRRAFPDEDVHSLEGVIRSISDGRCDVYFDEIDDDRTVGFDYLLPCKPQQGDQARVIFGNDTGTKGSVVSVDGLEGVLRISGSEGDIRIFSMSLLCKIC
ncbi:early transcription elongation factor of RNA pol II, NGN section domain-containing protein [Ditylenchus destructor]|uniref:Transcription elongation factor SPT5 n=1 Tax=Ditylenchus destructor TaxID=166010 RepID=A0AAD4N504_9BILA|nr:early transcription elongation factor of RNA pol II, NGN section domain-containing protein [Ditylenchus destructor]